MSHSHKTKAQLIQEIEALEAQVAALEPLETTVQQSSKAFREFMGQAYDGFVLLDETGTIIEWNESQARITGISSKEALGKKNWETLFELGAEDSKTPENYELIKKRTLDLLETGQAAWMKQSLERTIHRPDGEQRVVQSATFSIPTKQGFQIGIVTRDITALHESEIRRQTILDNAPAMIYIKDLQGRYIEINRHCERILGVSNAEAQGKTPHEVYPKHIAAMFMAKHQKVIETGQPFESEEVFQLDGESLTFLAVHFPLRDTAGEVYATCGISTDITDRKHAQEALRESERLAQAIANTTPSMLYIYDTIENKNVWVNATHRETFGDIFEKGASHISEKAAATNMNPEGLSAIVERSAKLQEGNNGEWLDVEYRMMATDGQLHWFHDRAAVFERDESGKVIKIIGSAIDITERKQAEEALRKSEARLAEAQTMAQIGSFEHHITEGLQYWSDALYDIFGFDPDQPPPDFEAFSSRIHPDDQDSVNENIRQSFKDGSSPNIQFRYLLPDGSIKYIHGRARVVLGDDGQPEMLIGTAQDMTEFKQTENELLKYKHIISATHDLLALTNPDYEYQAVNNSYLKFFNLTREEVIGQNAATLHGEEFFEKVLKPQHDQCLKGEVVHLQDWYDIEEYGRRYIVAAYYPFYGSQGTVEGAVVSIRDHTELKQAEEALRKSETRLADAQMIGQIGSFEQHVTEGPTYWSKELYHILGFDPDQPPPTYEEFASRIHPDDQALINGNTERAFKDGTEIINHFRYLIPGGLVKNVYTRARVILDAQGQPELLVGTCQDVSEFKQAERALQANQRYLSRLMGNLPGAAYRMKNDRAWSAEFLSEGIEDLSGYPPDDFLGDKKRDYGDLIHPDDQEDVWNNIQEALEKRQPFELNYRILTADGQEKWVWERGLGVFGNDRQVLAIEGFITDITELKQAEQALRESEERYRTLVEFAPITISIMSGENEIMYVNPAWEQSTGYTKEEALAMPAINLIHPDMRELTLKRAETRIDEEAEPVRHELKTLTKDGQTKWLDFSATTITIEGQPAILTAAIDITDRVRATQALQESEERYRSLVEFAPITISIMSGENEIMYVNPAWEQSSGYSREEAASMSAIKLVHPDMRETIAERAAARLRGESVPSRYELKTLTKDGRAQWMDFGATTITIEGKPAILTTGIDITDRREAAEALRRERDKAQTYLDIASVIMVAIDSDQNVSLINKKGCELLGYSEEEIIGKKWIDTFISEADRGRVKADFDRLLAGDIKPVEYYENAIINKDGEERLIAWSTSALRDEDGNITGTLSSGDDITERRRAEQALQESEERYRSLVEFAPIAISILEGSDSYRYVNPAWEQLTGYTREEAKTVRPVDLVHPDMHQVVKSRLVARMQGEMVPSRYELKLVTKEGKIKWADFSAAVITFEGQPAVITIANDITDRTQAEEAVRQERDKAQTYLDIVNVIMVAIDSDQQVTLINQKGCDLLGYSEEEIIGQNWFENFISELDRAREKTIFTQIVDGKLDPVEGYENTIVNKDGEERLIAWRSSLLKDEKGQVIGTLSSGDDITESRRAEQALKESEERYRSLVEFAPITISIMDRVNNRYLYVNPAWEQLTGYTREDAETMHPIDLIHPDMRQMVIDRSTARLRGEAAPSRYEAKILTKDGQTKWLDLDATIVTTEDQASILVIANDITDRTQAEEAVRRERDKAQTYLDIVNVIMVAIDSDQKVTLINQKGCEILGYSEENLVGKNWFDTFVPEADRDGAKVVFSQLMEGELELTEYYENAIINKDGEERLIAWRNTVLKNEEGEIVGTLSSGGDVTERRRAEQALRESEARYRTLFEQANDAILIENENDDILDVNQRTCDLLGYTREELLSMKVHQLQAPECRGAAGQVIRTELEQYQGLPFETTDLHKNGKRVPVEVTTSHLTGLGDGQALSIVRDITRRKRAEKELRQSLDLLNSTQRLSKVGGWEWEINSRTMFWTEETYRIHGLDPSISELDKIEYSLGCYDPGDRPTVEVAFRQCVEEGKKYDHEFPFNTPDGRKWIRVTAKPIRQDGKIVRVLGNIADVTERKEAEDALKRSEATLRSIFRAAPIGIGQATNRMLGWANDYLQEMIGYPHDELTGQSARILYSNQEMYEQVGRDLYGQIEKQGFGTLETQFKHKGGHLIDILLSSSAINPEDEEEGVVFAALDITKRKQMEQAEREQRIMAEALANTASALSSTLDLNEVFDRILDNVGRVVAHDTAQIMLIEDEVCKIIRTRGYEDQLKKSFEAMQFDVSGTSNLLWMFENRQPMVIDDVRHYQGWIPTPRMEQFHAYIGTPICVGNEVLGFLTLFGQEAGSFTDQHAARIQAFADQAAIAIKNAQLFEAERRERALAQTFQNVSAGLNSPVAMIDTLDQITDSLADALGYEQVALLLTDGDLLSMVAARGIDLTDLTQKRTFAYPEITALYLSMASGDPLIISVDDQPGTSEAQLPAFDITSTQGWIGLPLVVAEVIIGYLCVSTSKSIALKARDLEVVRAFAQQAEFVIGNSLILDELAVSLTNLHETRERLSRAARLSVAGEIAAGVAHQINNPLTTVVAQVYLLMKRLPTDHPGFKHAESIKQAAYRAGSVVQRMLDFGRPTPFVRQPLDVNESLKTAISLVRAQIEPHIAQIKVELAPDLPPVKGSSQHLEDVWLNLLLNARDALTSRDHGIISVTTKLNETNNTITIIIEDNGPGITSEDMIRVFDPFFTTKSHGTGLGLAICQDVIVKHNGTIVVNSVEDQGTTFTINLPV